MDFVINVLTDAINDSIKIFPFLFLIYVLMEAIENASNKEKIERALTGKLAPVVSGSLGIIPECGFSVMCAKLYDDGFIRTGTLIAAFISTSDEGLIVLLSNGTAFTAVANLFLYKMIFAVAIGFIVNAAAKKLDVKHVCPIRGKCAECGKRTEKFGETYFLHPFYHAGKTFLYVFALNVVFGLVFGLIGKQNVTAFLEGSEYFHPLAAALVGLIPNCASSIVIAQGYLSGALSFAGLAAGLSANAGVGALMLFKNKKSFGRGVAVMAIQFVSALVIGYTALFLLKITG